MPDDPTPGGTTTAGQAPAPVGAGLLVGFFRSPTHVMLAGLLGLGGVNVASSATRGEDPAAVEARIKKDVDEMLAQVAQESEDRALLKTAAECSAKVTKLTGNVDKLGQDLRQRDDDKFAFMSELTAYVQRIAAKLLGDKAPKLGARLNEYIKKGALRGVRGGE